MPGGFPLGLELCNGNDQGTDTTNSRGTAVAVSASANTYGSYVQLVASTPSDACWMTVTFDATAAANSGNFRISIAVGAAASEVVVVSDLLFWIALVAAPLTYSFPVSIPAGSRIAAKAAGNAAGGDTALVSVQLFDGSFTMMEGAAGAEGIGISTSLGTLMTAGAANTKGSYAQLIASTSKDYIGFCFALDGRGSGSILAAGQRSLTDIAIGAGGSEQIIVPNWPSGCSATNTMNNIISPFFPVPIPAGTRIAARWQTTPGSTAKGISLLGVYQ